MSRDDDLRFCGLYNLVEVKGTGRICLYIGGVLSSPERGGDWMEVRFEDGTHWRFRPQELKRPKGPIRISTQVGTPSPNRLRPCGGGSGRSGRTRTPWGS